MARPHQRRPGDPNPRPDHDATMDVVRRYDAGSAGGGVGYGQNNRTITTAVISLVRAWKQRRDGRRRRPSR